MESLEATAASKRCYEVGDQHQASARRPGTDTGRRAKRSSLQAGPRLATLRRPASLASPARLLLVEGVRPPRELIRAADDESG